MRINNHNEDCVHRKLCAQLLEMCWYYHQDVVEIKEDDHYENPEFYHSRNCDSRNLPPK